MPRASPTNSELRPHPRRLVGIGAHRHRQPAVLAHLAEDPGLSGFTGRVSDSGEGRWTINAAIDEAVPAPVLTAALYARFSSRGESDYQDKLLSALRFQFGGHREKPAR